MANTIHATVRTASASQGNAASSLADQEFDGRQASRYNANVQLIRRRLADEHRTAKSKPWWRSR